MNTTPNQPRDPLDAALQEWRVEAPLPPRFQEQVWHRIERAEASPSPLQLWQAVTAALEALVGRPRLALSYVTASLAIGLLFGYWEARQDTAAMDDRLAQRYVQSVDPYHKPGHL